MPMPDPKILSAFLEHYFAVKKDRKTDSMYGVFLSVGQSIGAIANHAEERKPKTEDIIKKITDAKSAEAWIEIALECGIEARAGQAAKTWPGDSDYAKAMHAIRSYIIHTLNADPILRKTLQAAIHKRLLELNGDPSITNPDDPKKLGLREAFYRNFSKGYATTTSKKAYGDKLIELADLGEIRSCSEATVCSFVNLSLYDPKQFETLKYKVKLNINLPVCYQPIYHIVYYLEEGMKANTKKLPGNKGEIEMHFSTYVTYLQTHSPTEQDVIDAEIFENIAEGHDFDDEPAAIQPIAPPPRQPKQASRRPASPSRAAPSTAPTLFTRPGFQDDGATWPQRTAPAPQPSEDKAEETTLVTGYEGFSLKKSGGENS